MSNRKRDGKILVGVLNRVIKGCFTSPWDVLDAKGRNSYYEYGSLFQTTREEIFSFVSGGVI